MTHRYLGVTLGLLAVLMLVYESFHHEAHEPERRYIEVRRYYPA